MSATIEKMPIVESPLAKKAMVIGLNTLISEKFDEVQKVDSHMRVTIDRAKLWLEIANVEPKVKEALRSIGTIQQNLDEIEPKVSQGLSNYLVHGRIDEDHQRWEKYVSVLREAMRKAEIDFFDLTKFELSKSGNKIRASALYDKFYKFEYEHRTGRTDYVLAALELVSPGTLKTEYELYDSQKKVLGAQLYDLKSQRNSFKELNRIK